MFNNKETDSIKRGTGSSVGAQSECESIDVDVNMASVSILSNVRLQNELQLNHKTKVSKVQPPSRIVYEWEWDIPKFDKAFPFTLTQKTTTDVNGPRNRVLKSNKIAAGADIGRKSEWYFQLSEASGTLSWHIVLGKVCSKSDSKWIYVAFSFKVVDSTGRELLQKKRCFRDFQENFKFGWDDVIDLEKLYAQKNIFLADNTLRTQVLFEMYANSQHSHNEALKQDRNDFAKLMTTDMWRLRTATGTADMHLECGGKVFPVHKLILSARSGTFARMFDIPKPTQLASYNSSTAGGDISSEREQSVSSISISEVESEILEVVLDFIYSGNVKPLTDHQILIGVVRAADKFELADLKAFCFTELMNFVTEENIGNLAVLAHRHNAERNVKLNINGYCLRNLTSLMKRKSFREALKTEPDAFFPDDEDI